MQETIPFEKKRSENLFGKNFNIQAFQPCFHHATNILNTHAQIMDYNAIG